MVRSSIDLHRADHGVPAPAPHCRLFVARFSRELNPGSTVLLHERTSRKSSKYGGFVGFSDTAAQRASMGLAPRPVPTIDPGRGGRLEHRAPASPCISVTGGGSAPPKPTRRKYPQIAAFSPGSPSSDSADTRSASITGWQRPGRGHSYPSYAFSPSRRRRERCAARARVATARGDKCKQHRGRAPLHHHSLARLNHASRSQMQPGGRSPKRERAPEAWCLRRPPVTGGRGSSA